MRAILQKILCIEIAAIFFFLFFNRGVFVQLFKNSTQHSIQPKNTSLNDREVLDGLKKAVGEFLMVHGGVATINGGRLNSEGVMANIIMKEKETFVVYRNRHEQIELVGIPDKGSFIPFYMKREKGSWMPVSLSFFGNENNISMGTSSLENYSFYEKILLRQYNSITIQDDTPWTYSEPIEKNEDVRRAQNRVRILTSSGVKDIRVHAILYPQNFPEWLKTGNFSKTQLRDIMKKRIEYIMELYPKATSFVIVNEPSVPNNGREKSDIFYRTWGNYNYITDAFQFARNYAKEKRRNVELLFNDGDNHYKASPTRDSTREIVAQLKKSNLIDGVGMQTHLGNWAYGQAISFDLMISQFKDELQYYKKIEVPVYITELTYAPSDGEMAYEKNIIAERINESSSYVFGELVKASIESKIVRGITTWGFTDKYIGHINWYQLFNDEGKPKKAYYKVLKELYAGAIRKQK
jgi:GH35 family endo-1,4-beta-xylanase